MIVFSALSLQQEMESEFSLIKYKPIKEKSRMQCKSQDFKISMTNFITTAATIALFSFILNNDDDTIFGIITINFFMDLEREGRGESVARGRTHKGVRAVIDDN